MGRVVAKESCPDCGSKDNLARYDDGSGYCFTPSCGYKREKNVEQNKVYSRNVQESTDDISNSILEYQYGNDPGRRVSDVVAKLFGVRYSVDNNGHAQTIYYPYHRG